MISLLKQKARISLQRLYAILARDINIEAETGPALVIAPHPDDESLGCGAVIARLREKGRAVRIIVVTDGAVPTKPNPQEIGAMRQKEAQDAGRVLGTTDVVFLNFPDEGCDTKVQAIEAALLQQINEFKPRQIFSPYGIDGHSDHRAIAEAVGLLHGKGVVNCPLYEYPIWFWNRSAVTTLVQPHRLQRLRRVATEKYLGKKEAAILAHRSQYAKETRDIGNFTFPPGFVGIFLAPYELFFEKPAVKH
jgi:LmbE family N-acetylglucosaminyl deacetylase